MWENEKLKTDEDVDHDLKDVGKLVEKDDSMT